MPHAVKLAHRSLIRIGGPDRVAFLQGIVSNDVSKATTTDAVYAALLTPQGKFLHDLFIIAHNDALLVDCEAARADDLLRRLVAYKLRAKVTLDNLADRFDIWALWNPLAPSDISSPPAGGRGLGEGGSAISESLAPLWVEKGFFPDPRLSLLGMRSFIEKNKPLADINPVDLAAYDTHRLILGIGDGSRDMVIGQSTLAEGNVDRLNGIDWKKGCYVGQELTARMHYRGLAKKRLFPVRIEGPAPIPGTALGEGGEMRSSAGSHGLAVLRIDEARQAIDQKRPLSYGQTSLWPHIPDWMKIDGTPANS